ncbi:DUF2956 domain-containing protein [Vibrio sp. HN007]|uniref:DUF2956 domain-containing protein n=1 Tax=Vibrio iocasae TaxID=3098914 RepID=UPI0035D4A94C
MKKNKTTVSAETQTEAMKIAKSTQKPGQTKEQTKLIAQGIEKGIAQYKKQQKERARQADKAKKKERKAKIQQNLSDAENTAIESDNMQLDSKDSSARLPWALLLLSWIGFITYIIVG